MLHIPNLNCSINVNECESSYSIKTKIQSAIVALSDGIAFAPKTETVEPKNTPNKIIDKQLVKNKRPLRACTLKKYASDSSACSNVTSDKKLRKKKEPRKKSAKPEPTVPLDLPATSNPTHPEEVPIDELKQFDCELCGQQFKSINRLHYHETAVHQKKPNTECDICGRVCKTLTYLKDHKRTHSTEKQFICSYCGKGFHVKFHLKEHIYMHTGLWPHMRIQHFQHFRYLIEFNISRRKAVQMCLLFGIVQSQYLTILPSTGAHRCQAI